MFPTNTPAPANLPSPQMVNNLASMFNTTATAQAKAAPAPKAAPATKAPAETTTTTGGGPSGPSNIGVSNDYITQLQQQLSGAQGAVSSAGQDIQTQIQAAIQQMQKSQQQTDLGIKNQYAALIQEQQTGYGATLFNTRAGENGLATSSVLLENLQNDNVKVIGQLMEQQTAAISQGDAATASKIADLMVQQQTLTMQNKQDVVQNMIAAAGAVNSAKQTQISQQQLQETMQNDIATLATKYGVTVKPGDNLESVINRVQPIASEQEQLTLAGARASIGLQNAQAALTNVQAATANTVWSDQDVSYMLNPTTLAMGPSTPDGKQAITQIMAEAIASNPQNFKTVSKAITALQQPHEWAPADLQATATYLRSKMTVGDAIDQYITQNPSITNKDAAAKIFRTVYNAPQVTSAGALLGSAFNLFIAPIATLGQGTTGQSAYMQRASSNYQLSNPGMPNIYSNTTNVSQ